MQKISVKPFSSFFFEIAKIKPRELRVCQFREIKYAPKLVRIR